MEREKIRKMALLGLVNGLLLSTSATLLANENVKTPNTPTINTPISKEANNAAVDPNSENLGYHLMTEDELLLELNDAGTKQYNALSPEGKALARDVASQRCQNSNSCQGLNACESEKNKCAGQGTCKGTSKCAFSDKNLAVRVVSEKMAKKRGQAVQGFGN
ncbi:MAG: hypothetical protein H0T62_13335 [Parachlamydiaceae bacterium]|nr:hypothetical protein [Parachlamydiaceae bacterium]